MKEICSVALLSCDGVVLVGGSGGPSAHSFLGRSQCVSFPLIRRTTLIADGPDGTCCPPQTLTFNTHTQKK